MKRPTIVAANWKMNGGTELVTEMTRVLSDIQLNSNVDVIICPSFPYLAAWNIAAQAQQLNSKIYLGAQNVCQHAQGAFTGEVSVDMLNEVSVNFVIIGHSERRSIYKETDQQVADKVKATLDAGLTPILCIGESEAERMAEQTDKVLAQQLQPVIDVIGIERFADIVIAYEPIWAIGTGKTASAQMAQQTHQFIRQFIANVDINVANKVPLLYGGSVNAKNSEELFAQTDIDGGLIGGASLKVDEFITICSAAKGS